MRRARGALLAACAFAVASIAIDARADDTQVMETRHKDVGSPQHFAIEVRGALYQARVDSDPSLGGKTPYGDAFGGDPRLEVGLELDWQVLRIPFFGTLGPGLGVGYTSMNGATRYVAGTYAGHLAGETTSLDIYPMYGVAVLRVDALDRGIHLPLVPYAKAGVGFAFWRASNTGGTSVASDGSVGRGHTFGTQFALGLDLDLGVFDPHAARELDNATGINHTYLFAEYMMSDLTGLGQSGALYVGTHSPVFGLAFEF